MHNIVHQNLSHEFSLRGVQAEVLSTSKKKCVVQNTYRSHQSTRIFWRLQDVCVMGERHITLMG